MRHLLSANFLSYLSRLRLLRFLQKIFPVSRKIITVLAYFQLFPRFLATCHVRTRYFHGTALIGVSVWFKKGYSTQRCLFGTSYTLSKEDPTNI